MSWIVLILLLPGLLYTGVQIKKGYKMAYEGSHPRRSQAAPAIPQEVIQRRFSFVSQEHSIIAISEMASTFWNLVFMITSEKYSSTAKLAQRCYLDYCCSALLYLPVKLSICELIEFTYVIMICTMRAINRNSVYRR